mgnify:CR=1 FL=1
MEPLWDEYQTPWERLQGEPERFYNYFRRFLRLGPERNLLRAYRSHREEHGPVIRAPINAPPQPWREAMRNWQWKERARLFDAFERELEDARWAARRREAQENAWNLSAALKSKAEAMLKFPLARTTTDNGRTIIEPIRWSMNDVAKLAQTSDALARLACDLATVRVVHEVDELTEKELHDEASGIIIALLREGRLSPEIESKLRDALTGETGGGA